jgi:outer membrane protein TolC
MPMKHHIQPRRESKGFRCCIKGVFLTSLCGGSLLVSGCGSDTQWVDEKLDRVLLESSRDMGTEAPVPSDQGWMGGSGTAFPENRLIDNSPPTDNPPAEDLRFMPQDAIDRDADRVAQRISDMSEPPANTMRMGLVEAIQFATINSLEYVNAEEDYLIAALALLIEEHKWEPRFFNNFTLDSEIGDFVGLEGRFDSALSIVNDFGVSQRLPMGGEVSASLIASTTNLLDNFFLNSGEYADNVDLVLSADIPLLRGAGNTVREPLIQAKRNLVYAARSFETFRRGYYLKLVTNYLNLVVQQQSIENAERSVDLFQQVEKRSSALVKAGRLEPFQADLAKQDTLFEIDRLGGLEERYRLAVDQFKLLIGMATELPVIIKKEMLDLDAPEITPNQAVLIALRLRLEVQTERDQIDDLRRKVDLAKNGLLSDLDLSGSILVPFAEPKENIGFDLSPDEVSFGVGLTFSAALDRVIEKYQLRQAQIKLEQSIRQYYNARDQVAVEVRSRVRAIERAQFSFLLQERNVGIAENRLESIEAAPDRASTRDRTEAVNALRRAEDQRDSAARDLQVAIVEYLGASGRLRVRRDGTLIPLPGMQNTEGQPLEDETEEAEEANGSDSEPSERNT